MEPKTKIQKRIWALSQKLPELTGAQKAYAEKHALPHLAYRLKSGKTTCLDCGHEWMEEHPLAAAILDHNCPGCGIKVKIETTRKKNFAEWMYYTVFTTIEEFQVIRLYKIKGYYSKGKAKEIYLFETSHVFIGPDGKYHVCGYVANTTWSGDQWSAQFELRNPFNINKYNIFGKYVYPRGKFIPELIRNGFTKKYYGMTPHTLFQALLVNPKIETLVKAGQDGFVRAYGHYSTRDKIEEYWNTIKICLRNNYYVRDATIYFDYLGFLAYFNKDLHNAKLVCPEDLHKQHDIFMRRKDRYEAARKAAEKRKEARAHERQYKLDKKKFFGLVFEDGPITIKLLESVQEFVEEGQKHKHCLYSGGYYKKKDSLCFSAMIDGNKTETIEFSLKDMKVIQARGLQNAATKHHKKILELFNGNIHLIKERLKPKKKPRLKKEIAQSA